MKEVRQDDFKAGSGNALQACVASILERDLASVPNFIKSENYMTALHEYLQPLGLTFIKIVLKDGKLENPVAKDTLCLLAGKSPRGDHRHVVVGKGSGTDLEEVFDPHPDNTGLDGPFMWAGLFVAINPVLSLPAKAEEKPEKSAE
eukprot:TRINITY_DN49086_c0_g2_i1.p1 TRINITY_DN49086_c0_g2~~TRINITY_DN49086_c0_g2_i1.p1  ORF type:complete len:160 (+),score=16.45 TRINITY_DN49086_c0_g2_i1:45-482(+)